MLCGVWPQGYKLEAPGKWHFQSSLDAWAGFTLWAGPPEGCTSSSGRQPLNCKDVGQTESNIACGNFPVKAGASATFVTPSACFPCSRPSQKPKIFSMRESQKAVEVGVFGPDDCTACNFFLLLNETLTRQALWSSPTPGPATTTSRRAACPYTGGDCKFVSPPIAIPKDPQRHRPKPRSLTGF